MATLTRYLFLLSLLALALLAAYQLLPLGMYDGA